MDQSVYDCDIYFSYDATDDGIEKKYPSFVRPLMAIDSLTHEIEEISGRKYRVLTSAKIKPSAIGDVVSRCSVFVSLVSENYYQSQKTYSELQDAVANFEHKGSPALIGVMIDTEYDKMTPIGQTQLPFADLENQGTYFPLAVEGFENRKSRQPAESEYRANLSKIAKHVLDLLQQRKEVPETPSATDDTVWLAQYKPSDIPTFEMHLKPGHVENWPIENFDIEQLIDEISVGDKVVIWRADERPREAIEAVEPSGVVGWAEVSRTDRLKSGMVELTMTQTMPERPISKDQILRKLGKKSAKWPGKNTFRRLTDSESDTLQIFASSLAKQDGDGHETAPETTETQFSSDRPETMRDMLGRAPLAFALAHKINDIYSEQNSGEQTKRVGAPDAPAFILHIDSPWGGGKTTFANYVARILNPSAFGVNPQDTDSLKGTFFENLNLKNPQRWREEYRDRKWINVHFNAWQHQHVSPPWWDFYEAIRKQSMDALPTGSAIWKRFKEGAWRIFSPELWRTMITVSIFAIIAYVIFQIPQALDWITEASEKSAAPFILATLTGASGLAIIGAVRGGVRKLINSAGESTDTTTLGTSDPMRRFRNHFGQSIHDLDRPVLIVVDDLDRCEPEYVVELIRGMLTVFRSPRIVFILLGDRNWIETAFEQVHKDMASAHRKSEISFGGRFVEKAIQMSLLLPEPHKTDRDSYFNNLLLGDLVKNEASDEANVAKLKAQLDEKLAVTGSLEAEQKVVDDLLKETPGASEAAKQMLNSTKAVISAAQTTKNTKNIQHAISPMKDYLPANPRRVKRIVNMIAIYHASAHAIFNVTKDDTPEKWYQVILWVMLLSEHPQCWKLLCNKPSTDERTEDENQKLSAPGISRLIDGKALKGQDVKIDEEAINWLRGLTPIR